jgi:hypothetical protein
MKNTLITGIMAASVLLAGCGKKSSSSDTPPAADAQVSKEESGLIGSWQTVEDSPTIYTFSKDHSVTETYKGHAVIQGAAMSGSWKLDGKKLVIMADSQTLTDSTGKATTVHPSSQQGTFTWTISSISDSAMTWHTSISRLGVTRDINLNLNRVSSP